MLRSLSRAGTSSASCFRASQSQSIKSAPSSALIASNDGSNRLPQTRSATTMQHAISNPTLADIEKRWEKMPPQEQAELWMALRDRMKNDWHDLTLQERKASYWIAFGPHGPRSRIPPEEKVWVFKYTVSVIAISLITFAIVRQFARPPPRTMNEQWQKASNEYLKKQKVEPISGVSSEGYTGKGMIQSKPVKGGIPKPAED